MIAVYLLGRRQARWWTLAAAATCTAAAALVWFDIRPLPTVTLSPNGALLLDLLGLLGVLAIVLVLALAHKRSLEQSEAHRRELADRVHAAQRLQSVGQLAGGVAHDFNNVLTVIVATCDAALDGLDDDSATSNDLRTIKAAGQRAAGLTRQLLLFSRQDVRNPAIIDPNQLVADLRPLLSNTLREDVDLATTLEPTLWPVYADRTQLEQVLLNLAANARDAMPEGGKLCIETHNVELDEKRIEDLGAPLSAGPHVQLQVSDDGEGMSDQTLAHAVEPFFTTKPKGVGTGLGLASVYGIVATAGGHLQIESTLGAGTTVRILLPARPSAKVAHAPRSLAPPRTADGAHERARTILLVDDERAVRASTRRLLIGAGFSVIEACDGEEALQHFSRHDSDIGLVITDVMMPNMNGAEFVELLRNMRPDLPVLFVTGYADDALSGPTAANAQLLRKPFSANELLGRIDELIRGEPSSAPPDRTAL